MRSEGTRGHGEIAYLPPGGPSSFRFQFRTAHSAFRIFGGLSAELLQGPGHVLPEGLHGLDPLAIVIHVSDISPYADIPIAGPDDDHLVD